jgi:hypothetical protein
LLGLKGGMENLGYFTLDKGNSLNSFEETDKNK